MTFSKSDKGGETNFGVTWSTYNTYRKLNNKPFRSVKLIEKEELFTIAAIVSKNSLNIATLAQQNNVQLEKSEEIETTEEDSQNNNN